MEILKHRDVMKNLKERIKKALIILAIILSLILIISGCKKRLALFLPEHSERTIKTIDKEFKHDPNVCNIADSMLGDIYEFPLTR